MANIESRMDVKGERPPLNGPGALSSGPFDPTGKYKLLFKGAYPAVEIAISDAEHVKASAGAMLAISDNVTIETRMEGAAGAGSVRCCGGTSIYFSYFKMVKGKGAHGDVMVAPLTPGDVILLDLYSDSSSWVIYPSSFLACDTSVNIGIEMLTADKGCCGGGGQFVFAATGVGRLLVSGFGGIIRYELKPDEVRKIDNGYLVAWTQGMEWSVVTPEYGIGAAASVLSGQGIICRFKGPGTVYVQTRSLRALAKAIWPHMST